MLAPESARRYANKVERRGERVDRLVVDQCMQLFANYGVPLKPRDTAGGSPPAPTATPSVAPDTSIGALLTFNEAPLTGSLLFLASFSLMASCRPAELRRRELQVSSAADWILVRDWTTELANQLQGRIRNQLSRRYHLQLPPKSPAALSGHPLSVVIRGRSKAPVEFSAPNRQTVRLWLEARLGPIAADREGQGTGSDPKEGDVILF
jgi:hypothetical protein